MKKIMFILISAFVFSGSVLAKEYNCKIGFVYSENDKATKTQLTDINMDDLPTVIEETFQKIDPLNHCQFLAAQNLNKTKIFKPIFLWGISKQSSMQEIPCDGSNREIQYYARQLHKVNSDIYNTVCGYLCY